MYTSFHWLIELHATRTADRGKTGQKKVKVRTSIYIVHTVYCTPLVRCRHWTNRQAGQAPPTACTHRLSAAARPPERQSAAVKSQHVSITFVNYLGIIVIIFIIVIIISLFFISFVALIITVIRLCSSFFRLRLHPHRLNQPQTKLDNTGYSTLPSPPRLMQRAVDMSYKWLRGHTHTPRCSASQYLRLLSGSEGNNSNTIDRYTAWLIYLPVTPILIDSWKLWVSEMKRYVPSARMRRKLQFISLLSAVL